MGLIVYIEPEEMAFCNFELATEDFKARSAISHTATASGPEFSSKQDNQASTDDYSSTQDNQTTRSRSEFAEILPYFSLNFDGRIGRITFINYFLLYSLIAIFPVIFVVIMTVYIPIVGIILIVIGVSIFLWLYFRISVLRLHDMNLTGGFSFIYLLLLASCIATSLYLALIMSLIFALFLMGYPGYLKENDYGKPEKQGSYVAFIIIAGLVIISLITRLI